MIALVSTADDPGYVTVTAEEYDLALSFYDEHGRYLDAVIVPVSQTRRIAIRSAYFALGLAAALSADPVETYLP